MSLFLGQIHYWLYNKILWFERIENEIIEMAIENESRFDEVVKDIYNRYGEPTSGKKLEDIIDTSNIHGWLQSTIEKAELRQAAIVTALLNKNPKYMDKLIVIFTEQGKLAGKENTKAVSTPEDIFNALNDFILEGMPCDRVNEVVSSTEIEFSWKTTTCLHKAYWDEAQGNVQIFYKLRQAWITAFVQSAAPNFKYEKDETGMNKITKK